MEYLVTGAYRLTESCNCEFCPGHEHEREYHDTVFADSAEAAVNRVKALVENDLDWDESIKWLGELKAVEVEGAWFFHPGIMAADGYRTDGFMAIKEQYTAIQQPVTSDKQPAIAEFVGSMRPIAKLSPGIAEDGGRVMLLKSGDYTTGIDTRYYLMFQKLGCELWRSTGATTKDGGDPVIVIKDGEKIGAVMPMTRHSWSAA